MLSGLVMTVTMKPAESKAGIATLPIFPVA